MSGRVAGADAAPTGHPTVAAPPSAPIPVVFAIDVEPDGKPMRRTEAIRLDGFRAMLSWTDELRVRLERLTGHPANFAWFLRMDPQIREMTGGASAVVDIASDEIARLGRMGDSIGLHTHAGRWSERSDGWLVDHADPDWIEHCVRTAFAAYAEAFGVPCREHRFGDRWSSEAALDLLADMGAIVDLSAEPGRRRVRRVDLTAPATGHVPSYLHMRSVPQPHGDGRLWLLPLTAADPGPALAPIRRVARRIRFAGQPRHRPLQVERPWRSPDRYWSVVERALADHPAPYLAVAVRSDLSLTPAMGPVRALFAALERRPLARRLRFVGASTALTMARSALTAGGL